MKRILSERHFVVILFVLALVTFVFAQQEAKKVEKKYLYPDTTVSSLQPSSPQKTVIKNGLPQSPVVAEISR